MENVVLMDIINSLLKTGNKTANICVKTAVYTHCYIFKKAMLITLTLTFRLC